MRALITVFALVFMAGCTTTYVKTKNLTAWRVSLLQRVNFAIDHTDEHTKITYGTDGGQPSAGSIAKAAALILK